MVIFRTILLVICMGRNSIKFKNSFYREWYVEFLTEFVSFPVICVGIMYYLEIDYFVSANITRI